MDTLAPTLMITGLILLGFEVIVPGGILGFIGGCCLLGGSIDIWIRYGYQCGMAAIFASIVAALLFLFLEIRFLKKLPITRHLFLDRQTAPTKTKSAEGTAIGAKGTTITRLNPSGLVQIGDKRLEAISRDGMIEEGAAIEVAGDDAFRIVVKRVSA